MTDTKRVAVVTGGGQGIGAAIATTLASKGDEIAVLDVNPDAARETCVRIIEGGGRAIPVTCDVSDVKQVAASIELISDELGPPNVLVNNAGVTRDNLVFRMTDEDWDAVLATHLTGSFYMTREVQTHMVSQRYGKIVFISSRASLGNRGQTNYSAAKAGMIGMMKTLAIELGPFNVNVNAIAPGHITTDMTQGVAERLGQDYEEMKRSSIAINAIKRVGVPQDVADAVEYLASDRASYVTGQVLYVTGRPTV